jgi:hypothetical protein
LRSEAVKVAACAIASQIPLYTFNCTPMATATALNQKVKGISGEFCKWFTQVENFYFACFQ